MIFKLSMYDTCSDREFTIEIYLGFCTTLLHQLSRLYSHRSSSTIRIIQVNTLHIYLDKFVSYDRSHTLQQTT